MHLLDFHTTEEVVEGQLPNISEKQQRRKINISSWAPDEESGTAPQARLAQRLLYLNHVHPFNKHVCPAPRLGVHHSALT